MLSFLETHSFARLITRGGMGLIYYELFGWRFYENQDRHV